MAVLYFLTLVAYLGFLVYVMRVPPMINIWIVLGSFILAMISFFTGKKLLLMLAFLVIFFGILIVYPVVIAHRWIWPWVGALAATIFFGVLSIK